MRPGDRTVRRSSVSSSSWWGVVHNTPSEQAASTVASASGSADPTACTWEAEQGPGRAAAPGLWFDGSGVTPTACAAYAAGPPTPAPQSSSDSSAVRSSSSINQSRAVGLQSIRNSLSNAPNSPSSVPRLRAKEDPRHKSPRSVICRTR